MKSEERLLSLGMDILERIAYIADELEEIVNITKGRPPRKTSLPLGRPEDISGIFKFLVLKNILQGRMALSVYLTGKEIGLSHSLKTKDQLVKVFEKSGLGHLQIKTFTETDITVELTDGLSARDMHDLGVPVCYFEAGFLGGILENLLGRRVDFREVQCRGRAKDKRCVFKLLRPGEETKIEGVTIPILMAKEYSEENIRLLTSLAAHSIAAIENTLVFETARNQSLIDALTETYNHRFFQQMIRTEMRRASRHDMPLSLIMCDIDRFKALNDKYSHSVGDQALKIIARILVRYTRDIDYVCRYGGDEFMIILPQTDREGALVVAERIKEQVNQQSFPDKKSKASLSISFGIASCVPGKKDISPQELIDKADQAMMAAKKTRSRIVQA